MRDPGDAARTLLAALRQQALADACNDAGADAAASAQLRRAVELMDALGEPSPPPPCSQPCVDAHMAAAAVATVPRTRDLGVLVAELARMLCWQVPYDAEADAPAIAAFRKGYAFALLAGPTMPGWAPAAFTTDDLLLGFVLQAPGVDYPRHSHPATEIYSVIGGAASWFRHGGWHDQSAGSIIVHPGGTVHATVTGDEPTLLWFAWIDHPSVPPVLTPSEGAT